MISTKRLQRGRCTQRSNIVLKVIVAAMVGMVALWLSGGSAHAQGETTSSATLHVDAPAQVAEGEPVVLTLRLEGAVEVGGFEAQLLYAREAGEYAGFKALAAAGEFGVGQLAVPEMATGSAIAFYTCHTDPCLQLQQAQIVAAAAPGALAQVEVLPLAVGQLEVRLDHVQVVDRQGRRVAVTIPQDTIVVQVGESDAALAAPATLWEWSANAAAVGEMTAAAADLTQDGEILHADLMEVALGWQIMREEGKPCGGSEMLSDINGDGCVDIVDLQMASAFVGSEIAVPETPEQTEQLFLPLMRGEGNPSAEASATMTTAAMTTWVVNSALDEWDVKIGNGVCRTTSKVCTLRAAIAEANARSGPDTIVFAIPGNGVQTIQLTNRLPTLNDGSGGITIDGYSQPGAAPNSDPLVSNAQIRIQVRGNGIEGFDGLAVTSASNVIKGLSFFNLKRSLWVFGAGANDNVIAGNFIGTDAAGVFKHTVTSEKQTHGVQMEQGARNNRIGGVSPAERNVVGGNARHGIGLWHSGTRDNLIVNNLVGLAPNGTRRLANRLHGVDINYGASYNMVGGPEPGMRNVISGNNGKGAEISHGTATAHNTIIGNYIGTNVTGTAGPSYANNSNYGISVKDRVVYNLIVNNVIANNNGGVIIDNFGTCCASFNRFENNRIGVGVNGEAIGNRQFGIWVNAPQNQIGPGNLIAYNPLGIQLQGNTHDGNTITQNSIFANTGLGIDIAPLSSTNANDAGDGDAGPNEQLNFPELASASPTQVTGSACAGCVVEIFVADGGAGEYGEGRTFAGSGVAAANGSFTVQVSGVSTGVFVTATATDAAGNTSEFARNIEVVNS